MLYPQEFKCFFLMYKKLHVAIVYFPRHVTKQPQYNTTNDGISHLFVLVVPFVDLALILLCLSKHENENKKKIMQPEYRFQTTQRSKQTPETRINCKLTDLHFFWSNTLQFQVTVFFISRLLKPKDYILSTDDFLSPLYNVK